MDCQAHPLGGVAHRRNSSARRGRPRPGLRESRVQVEISSGMRWRRKRTTATSELPQLDPEPSDAARRQPGTARLLVCWCLTTRPVGSVYARHPARLRTAVWPHLGDRARCDAGLAAIAYAGSVSIVCLKSLAARSVPSLSAFSPPVSPRRSRSRRHGGGACRVFSSGVWSMIPRVRARRADHSSCLPRDR